MVQASLPRRSSMHSGCDGGYQMILGTQSIVTHKQLVSSIFNNTMFKPRSIFLGVETDASSHRSPTHTAGIKVPLINAGVESDPIPLKIIKFIDPKEFEKVKFNRIQLVQRKSTSRRSYMNSNPMPLNDYATSVCQPAKSLLLTERLERENDVDYGRSATSVGGGWVLPGLCWHTPHNRFRRLEYIPRLCV